MRQLIRFGVAGTVGFVADAAVLYALMGFGFGAYLARVLSFLFAAFVTWRINRRYTFGGKGGASVWREWCRYLSAMSLGGACNYGIYAVLLAVLPRHAWTPMIALAIGSLTGMGVNFVSAKFWVFDRD